jgi:hypothetical protein
MSILKLVHGQLLPQLRDPEATHLEQLFQLVRCTCDLQSEPDSLASELLERLHAFDALKKNLLEIRQAIQGGQQLAVDDWLVLSYLATLKRVLKDQWDDYYKIIFDHYPALGQEISRVQAFIEDMPFAAAATLLEKDWEHNGKRPGFEIAALTYVTACGLIGIFGSSRLYEKAADCLAFAKAFLVVVLAGGCFKVRAIASRVNIGDWADTQYACMSMLDNFAHLGETAWG